MLPQALEKTIEALGMLPGVGHKTAERYAYYLFRSNPKIADNIADALANLHDIFGLERYAYYLFRSNPKIADNIADALANLHDNVKSCPVTFALIDASEEISPLYDDPTRDKTTVLVVEEPLDIYAIEQTHGFKGTYHVLGGAVSPIDGITPDQLHIHELIQRVEKDNVTEVIIATNPSVEGESTALLLDKMLHDKYPELKVTRLARGLPLGVDLSYADQITLSAALENRTKI